MDTSIIIHSDDVIQHFGVKGMKWGVRRMYNNHVENLRYKYRKKGYSEEVVENKLKKRLRQQLLVLRSWLPPVIFSRINYKMMSLVEL